VRPLAKLPYCVRSVVCAISAIRAAIAFGENVHRQTERHLELVTGGRTSTAHTR
jgi:hypothetical protein